jgi:hypothetical protein
MHQFGITWTDITANVANRTKVFVPASTLSEDEQLELTALLVEDGYALAYFWPGSDLVANYEKHKTNVQFDKNGNVELVLDTNSSSDCY